MKKLSLLIILLLMAVAPALAIGEEKQAVTDSDFSFYVNPLAGPDQAEFELFLINNGNAPLTFEFPTSQKYEIIVTDAKKNKVYQYSEGMAFAQVFEKITLKPQESIKWQEKWDYSSQGVRVSEGEYTVTAELKAVSVNGKDIADKSKLRDIKTTYIPGENPVFKAVKSEGSAGNYHITGEARPIDGKFYYSVEDGHNQQIPQTEVNLGVKYPEWKRFSFNISIPAGKLPENGSLMLNLYELGKDGSIIHTYPVLLENFNSLK
jgi:hypothetical protein